MTKYTLSIVDYDIKKECFKVIDDSQVYDTTKDAEKRITDNYSNITNNEYYNFLVQTANKGYMAYYRNELDNPIKRCYTIIEIKI